MTTFTFTAFQEQELLQNGDNNLNVGDTIEIPGGASVTFTVQDDDSTLSGDNYTNENANDSTGQTASITEPGGGEVGNGGQIYAESYYWVYDSNGSWFLMLEIEQEGTGEQYYTFHESYGTPPSGTTLTVHSVCNVTSEWVDYNCLDAGEVPSPGSIAGRYFYDSDGDNTEWNADTNSWEEGVSGKLVFLFDANWNEIARTTTDESGNYSFDGLEPGTHHVMFEGTEGTDFVQPDVGDSGADSDVTWTDQNGTGGVWGVQVHPGQTTWNVDAGIVNTLTDGNEASTVDEDAGVVTLTNVLLNTVDPEAGDPVVYAVWGENGPMTGNVGQPIAGSNGGIFVINADGSITFDTNGAFDNLETGETTTTDIWYCVKDAAGKIVESKYTVTIIGEDEPVVVTAADDFITVFETETAGDLEILDDGSDSVLDNDTQNGVDYTGNVVEVNGVAGQVGQFIDLDGGGRVMINADGSVDFDANGDFDALNDGDTDMVTVDYTIRTQEQADKPQNVLIVIDVSNSTVSLDSGTQNVFDGAGVGDVNGDGRADTVLDAQIVAAQALIDDLRSQGLDSSLVNIGIATFSGVDTTGASSYNDATVDSEVVGTFNLNDAGIDSALAGILSGSWTNYEAGLSEAESWFGANAQAGDGNTMYFLSDGRPVTSYENGAYVEQDTAAFLDELGQIEANYGATIHAVGVGANSSLEVLDQIDNTGGAVQVTDAASLTAALLNTADMDTEQASATVTITVLGEDDPIVVTAADDFITVFETETAGDLEILDDGSDSVLDNDTQNGVDYTGNVVEVNGVAGQVGQFIDLDGGGRVMINADGSVDFDANGDFDALNDGDTDMVTVDYTIRTQEQADKPQNVLIVIDVSNSTVSLDSGTQNVFDGAGVGDVNGDGRADTVLDAQIVAAQALIDDLRSQGLDSSLVNIGIATFSGVDTTGASSYNDATVDSEVVGTFNLNDAGIDSALAGILSGSWTNYEAGLSEAESWFGANAQAGDGNTMYFLSDGRPVTSYENGAYVEQDTAAFLDELGQIEANYGATIHAVGVGANSSLEVLDQIDNTGGAVQVTDAASLTAALLNTADMDTEQASATVTITVLGEDDPVAPLAAVDDFITVMETEGAGDLETLDDGSASILTNDTDGSGPYTGMVVEVAGVSGNVGEWLKLTKGQIMINGDGTVDFDAMGEFEALANNESDMVQVDYTISRMESTSSSRTITFEEFSRGDVISNQIAGLTIEAQRNGDGTGSPNDAMIFDSVNWSGGDDDLQTTSNGNLLIISEDNDSSDPDDNAGGGKIVIDFDNATQVDELTFVDTEEGGATITLAFEDGTSTSLTGPQTLDGEIGTFTVGIAGVVSMEIALNGSGAIDNLILTESTMAPVVEAEANVFVTINGENVLEDGDESGVTDEETAITLTNLLDNTVDPEAGEPTVILAEGQSTSNGAVTVAGSNGGTFTIASDGTASFDPGTDFLELDDDESLATTATYMVEDAAGDVVTSTVSVIVNGISDPATFELGGTITTQSSASQSLTFIVDYSVATWTTQAGVSQLSADGSAIDLNGDGLLSLIDTVLDNIVASVQDLPADQKVNFIIADAGSADGIVSTFEVTAGSLQGAANSSSPSMALSAILAAGGDPTDPSTQKFGLAAPGGSTGTGLDIKQALDAAKTYVAANDSDIDEVVVVSSTSTFSLDPNEWIYVGDPRYDPAEDPDGNGFIITPATSADGVVAELAALGATVDVVVINSSDSTVLQPLSTVDADGLDVVSKDNLNGFGLDQLISDPSVIDTGDVIGVKVNGIEYSATDADAAADGFQLELANLPDDPKATGTLLLVDDGTSVNEIDITDDLTQIAGTDRFEFTFDLA